MKENQVIRCHACGRRSEYRDCIKTRPVEGYPLIIETGILCPYCDLWIHAQFDGPALAPFRAKLKVAAAAFEETKNSLNTEGTDEIIKKYYAVKTRMKKEHERFNAHWREKLGVKSPAELMERHG